ncbi:TPA: hypothetical protein U2B84_000603 [Streptococcus suis]|nr:hypothetical protein [Streptococcus suis]HEM6103331.1 hypothetical protein [Streptococcus suis]
MSQPVVPLTIPQSRRIEKKSRNDILMKIRHGKTEVTFFQSINQNVLLDLRSHFECVTQGFTLYR